ncbi:MAG: carboxypeptidase regulatory-like domain-containing protein [Gemmatimonadaceae bacterium]
MSSFPPPARSIRALYRASATSFIFVAVTAHILAAQQGTAVVRGAVTDTAGRPLAGAEVTVRELQRSARSDAAGIYTIGGLAGGVYTVVVRRLGYRSRSAMASLSPPDTLHASFRLEPEARTLDTVSVSAPATPVALRLKAFEARRTDPTNFGRFITEQEIERQSHSTLSNVLRGKVARLAYVRHCHGGYAVASPSGAASPALDPRPKRRFGCVMPNACYMQVYLDGVRLYSADNPGPPPKIDDFKLTQLAGIEIYRGGAETPPEFNSSGAACGTIVMWTKG